MGIWKSRLLLVSLLIIVLGLTFILPGYASPLEQRIKDSEQELSKIQGFLESRSQELAECQSEGKRLEKELNNLKASISQLQAEINLLEADIEKTEENIVVAEEELEEAEAHLKLRDELLQKRLRAIYENGDTSYLDVLFSAYTFSEFLTRLNDLKLIAENDLKLLEEAYIARNIVQEKKEKLEEERAHLLALKREMLGRREELDNKLARQEVLLAELQKETEKIEKAIEELEREAAKVEKDIKRLQEEYRSQTEQFKPSGRLLWPLAEYGSAWITSPYGNRTDPITGRQGVFHGGIDIGIPRTRWPGSSTYNGNPVQIRASDDGIVIFAGINGTLSYGYGRMVIVDHGQGITTLYAHCHSLLVSPGQVVSQGQPLAIVGSTGSSTGPHVHFEVRVNGTRQNPMNYL
jgi:murein DD-endopeptidase MepM/ murein hydrolase activator NlpD